MFFILFVLANSETVWQDPVSGLYYDWTSLARQRENYYEVIDSNEFYIPSVYLFNFGDNLPRSCTGQFPAAMETIEFMDGWMESCSILGRSDMTKVKSISGGVQITYDGGDLCYNIDSITNRKLSLQLVCSKTEGDWTVVQSSYTNYCSVILKKKTLAGCPLESSSSWVWWAIFLFGSIAAFFGAKMLYNVYKDSDGSLNYKEYFGAGVEKITGAVQAVIGKAKNYTPNIKRESKNYEMV